jgi:hypothetical protein
LKGVGGFTLCARGSEWNAMCAMGDESML